MSVEQEVIDIIVEQLGVDREALVVERLGCDGNGFQGVKDPKGLAATRLVGTFHMITIPISVRRTIIQAVESAGLEVTNDELHGAVESLKAMVGPESGELHLEGTPQEKRISTDILRQKAMDTLLASAVPVDGSGRTIDFKALAAELVEPEEEEDDEVVEVSDEVVDSGPDNEDTDAPTEDEEE